MTTFTLWLKLLRDIRVPLLIVALLLFGFEALWVKITSRITTELSPLFRQMSLLLFLPETFVQQQLFSGPGKVFQTILGGENIRFENPQDLLAVGYMHPLVQTILSIWAVGRAAGAIAGEIDRGTMELLLAQPMARSRLILAHLCVDLVTIPVICLSMWAGTVVGTEWFSPFVVDPAVFAKLKVPVPDPLPSFTVSSLALAPGLWNVAALMFALSGISIWISSMGRSRNRVLGIAVFLGLLQFICNVLGQLWDGIAFLRPFTVYYYYQPQQINLHGQWKVDPGMLWFGQPMLPVHVVTILVLIGAVGYGLALRHFCRRDIPAPL